MQKGRIYQHGNQWMLRYRIPVEVNGKKAWRDCYQTLAEISDRYGSVRSVEHLAKPFLDKANGQSVTTFTTQLVRDFIEYKYLPHIEKDGGLAPSTVFGYCHIFNKHLKDRLGDTSLCDFTTNTGYRLLQRIAKEAQLSRTSLKHIKWFLAAVFNYAKNEDAFRGANPMPDVELPAGADSKETHAYSLDEIYTMLSVLTDEPLAGATVAAAAFSGLRRSELRGLRWEDLRDNQLFVTRSVWGTKERDKTKTTHSKAPVPVIPLLGKYLEDHRNGLPDKGYIFAGLKMGKPLNLANLARRTIVPTLEKAGVKCWCGWHGFRRGLATNLYELGIAEPTIQAILRHADVETTRKHYIKKNVVPEASRRAMSQLEKVLNSMRKTKAKHGSTVMGTNLGTTRKARKRKKSLRLA